MEKTENHAIAIIGGGFSGAMVLWHLIDKATEPLHIYWYEEAPKLAAGLAYGYAEIPHLLNVRADKMGALPQQVDGFYQWLRAEGENENTASSFQPRQRYAGYLQSLLKQALANATAKNIRVFHQVKRVESLAEFPEIKALVMATGTPPPRKFKVDFQQIKTAQGVARSVGSGAALAPAHLVQNKYMEDSWRGEWPANLAAWSAENVIGIIGTGLTGVDAILSLEQRGYRGKIIAFSRHGWLPAEHATFTSLPAWEPHENNTRGLMRAVVARARKAEDWRAVVDSLRPHTPALWQKLSVKEQQKFLRKCFALWNIHRHRMAPEIGEKLRLLQQQGRLEIKAMRLEEFLAQYQPALLINCTGPDFDITRQPALLLQEMLAGGLVQPDALRLGLAVDAEGRAISSAAYPIFPMGTLTLGTYFECIAVPELRVQAERVAQQVLRYV